MPKSREMRDVRQPSRVTRRASPGTKITVIERAPSRSVCRPQPVIGGPRELFIYLAEMGSETGKESEGNPREPEESETEKYGTDVNYKHKYIWQLVTGHVLLQLAGLIGMYSAFAYAKRASIVWGIIIGFLGAEGIGLAAHRAYTHRSFKPSRPLKIFLILCQTMAGQNSIFTWARDHMLHHKYSDTDADPHNSNRGFFFSHMGWLMMEPHPLLLQKKREIDVSELRADKLIMFQRKYFLYIYVALIALLPIGVPMYFWDESFWNGFFVVYCFQYVTNLHVTWTVNSFAHLWGSKPYDTRIRAAESYISSILTLGDGWHNFHHAFPWDYRNGEKFCVTAKVIDLLAYLGLAYDLKTASPAIINGHLNRHGKRVDQGTLAEKLDESQRNGTKNVRAM